LVARASPIRDMIGEFLSVPRAAREVAEYIDRPVPVATGHLAAMCRLGLAQRIGQNVYATANSPMTVASLPVETPWIFPGIGNSDWRIVADQSPFGLSDAQLTS
jgi:hypothetical protein